MTTTEHELRRREKNSRLIAQYSQAPSDLGPIVGYAQEPILPLSEACIPLIDIIDDILIYVSVALEATPKDSADGLTRNEAAAICLYTIEWPIANKSLYAVLNRTLKTADRDDLKPWYKYLKLFLTALVKLPCAPLQTVWRRVRQNISNEFQPGTPVTWWGFSSCTTTLTVLESDIYLGNRGERTLFSIETLNGRNIRGHSYFKEEDEILLLPGTYMEVKSQFNPASDLHIIHLKQNTPEELLLEPPFENACLYPKYETSWYRKKRFFLPVIFLAIISVVAVVTGAVFESRSTIPRTPINRTSINSTIKSSAKSYDGLWVEAKDGQIPPNAVVGGQENNRHAYVVRFKMPGDDMIPGKLIEQSKTAEGGYYGVRTSSTYEVLTNPNSKQKFKWVPTSGFDMPEGALLVGRETGSDVYMGRIIQTSNSIILGKYHARDGEFYFTQDSIEKHAFTDFEVLCVS